MVNAPEKGLAGAAVAKKALEEMILGKEVDIQTVGRDEYRRSVAKVKEGRRAVNKAMVEKLK